MDEELSQKEQFLKDNGKFNIEIAIAYNQVYFHEDYAPVDGVNVFATFEEAKVGAQQAYKRYREEAIAEMLREEERLLHLTEDEVQRLS